MFCIQGLFIINLILLLLLLLNDKVIKTINSWN